MNLKIKLIDTTLPTPEYKTTGAVAFDLYSRIDLEIPPKTLSLIPLNVIIQIPPGYFIGLFSRSSLPIKKNLMCANGVGVMDADFCGSTDEYKFEAYNFSDSPIKIERGERICQAVLIPYAKPNIELISEITEPSRGGLGSTGS
ncbi:MAG: dUTP diphosphatase [Patescibacteria group bacterium]